MIAVCFSFGQALEESAANAAEEERRRLQTQTELQDRYRMDLEREKMVRRPFVIYQCALEPVEEQPILMQLPVFLFWEFNRPCNLKKNTHLKVTSTVATGVLKHNAQESNLK